MNLQALEKRLLDPYSSHSWTSKHFTWYPYKRRAWIIAQLGSPVTVWSTTARRSYYCHQSLSNVGISLGLEQSWDESPGGGNTGSIARVTIPSTSCDNKRLEKWNSRNRCYFHHWAVGKCLSFLSIILLDVIICIGIKKPTAYWPLACATDATLTMLVVDRFTHALNNTRWHWPPKWHIQDYSDDDVRWIGSIQDSLLGMLSGLIIKISAAEWGSRKFKSHTGSMPVDLFVLDSQNIGCLLGR